MVKLRSELRSVLWGLSFSLLLLLAADGTFKAVEAGDPNGDTETFTFYIHCTDDVAIVAGPGKEQTDLSRLAFGSTVVFDNDVTVGPSPESKSVGRRQGIAVMDNYGGTNYYLLFTVILENHDKYSGTFQVGGTEIGSGDREISIIGGTGDFRGARGYSPFHLYDSTVYPIVEQKFVFYKNSFNYKPSVTEAGWSSV